MTNERTDGRSCSRREGPASLRRQARLQHAGPPRGPGKGIDTNAHVIHFTLRDGKGQGRQEG
eukprot:3388960-Pyramimonas_sp.AAC.1